MFNFSWDGTPGCKYWESFMTSLYKCDFHGAHIKVVSSKCCSYILVAGVIVLETKNTFQIVGVDNKLKSELLNYIILCCNNHDLKNCK